MRKLVNISLKKKRNLKGWFFISPFIIGFILFFLYPFIQAFRFSVSSLKIDSQGYELIFTGIQNYKYSLMVHGSYVRELVETIGQMLTNVPMILIYSFFAALLLNQKYKGRFMARVIFFLPVIMASGIVLRMEQGDLMMEAMQGGEENTMLGPVLENMLFDLPLPVNFLEYIIAAVENIPQIIRASGIQILIFLAGLQSIPASLYEAADVEGATGWESFWMITFPMLTPLILTNIVYTIIDSFIAPYNELIELIRGEAFGGGGYGVSSAMAIIYFLAIAFIILLIGKFVSRFVFYYE
ncbi:MAG: carbohydrate ABC transporter permease [Bacillota bacterium]